MQPARRLSQVLEPFVGQVYFSPECHANYVALGFSPSAGDLNGVALPDGPAYFTSRGSLMGQVPGELVAAAFAVFNPAVVVPAVTYGWTLTDASRIGQARDDGAIGQLRRLLGEAPDGIARAHELLSRAVDGLRPEGRPLFAGVLSQTVPDDDLGASWRLGDQLREYRGDAHTAAWTSAGFDATEIGLLSELYWGLAPRSYARTRAWTDAQFDAAEERLTGRGLLNGGTFTDAGRAAREAVEEATDAQCLGIVDRLGDDLDELVALLDGYSTAVRAGHGYPATGPQELAARARRRPPPEG